MTGSFEDDRLGHLSQEIDQWDPDLDLFYYLANQDSPVDEVSQHDYHQQAPSPTISAITAAPAPPTPSSFDPFPDTTDDSYDNLSSVGDDAISEIPATDLPSGLSDVTSPMMSTTEEEHESTAGQEGKTQWPTSHGKVSMGVNRIGSNTLKCRWEGCNYSGEFSGIAALLRHIKTKHVCPGLFECTEEDCQRSFNRKDNLVAHMRNVHRGTL